MSEDLGSNSESPSGLPAIESELREARESAEKWRQAHADAETRLHAVGEELASVRRWQTTVLDCISEGFVILDREWRFVYANPAAETFIQKSSEQLLGHSQWELFPAAGGRRFGTEYRRAVAEGVPVHFEEFYPRPLNRWFEVRAYPSAEGLSIFFRDITDRKRIEEELRINLAKYSALFKSFPLGISVTDANGRLVETNEAAVRLLGVSEDAHTGRRIDGAEWRVIRPDGSTMPPEEYASVRALKERRRIENVEMGVDRGDGTVAWISTTAAPLDLEGYGVVVVYGDISARRRAELALDAARHRSDSEQRRFDAVMDAVPIGMAILDARNEMVTCNRAYERMWGGTLRTVHSIADLADFHARYVATGQTVGPEQWAPVQALRHGVAIIGQEIEVQRPDGTRAVVLSSAAPIFEPGGSIVGSAVAIQDITSRVEAERALTESQAALRQANLELTTANERLRLANGLLEARVSLRTADLERRTTQLRALAAELTRAEERERRRVAQLIHDQLQQLLVAARLNLEVARRQHPSVELQEDLQKADELLEESITIARTLTADLSPSVLFRSGLPAGLQWLCRWVARTHGLEVDLDMDGHADVASEETRIALFGAARELLFNVVKHAQVGRAELRLALSGDDVIEISVRDEGVGFEARAESASDELGAGFGLFSLRERLALLGGRLEIESALQHGSRVTIRVPRRAQSAPRPSQPVESASSSAAAPVEGSPAPKPIRIMLVDDHAIVRDGLVRAFSDVPDFVVVGQGANGEEAVALVPVVRPHVVVMDTSMPGMDGIEATRRILAENPTVRVIGLTMFDDEFHHDAMRRAGAVAVLDKSIPVADVVAMIRRQAGWRMPAPPHVDR